jgi:hypothetical protein
VSCIIGENDQIYFKTKELSINCENLDKESINSQIKEISNMVLGDTKLNTLENKQIIASLVLNENARNKLCNKLCIDKINPNTSIKWMTERNEIINKKAHNSIHLLNSYDICNKMTNQQKLNICITIPKERIDGVMKMGENLISNEMSESDIVIILKGLHEISKKMYVDDITRTREILSTISPEKRVNFVELAPKLFTEKMNSFDKAWIIKALAGVPQGQLADLVEVAPKLFTKKIRGFDQASIITVLAKMPQAQRTELVEFIIKLSNEEMNGYDKVSLLNALAIVPQGQLDDLMEHSQQLFNEKSQVHDKTLFVIALASMGCNILAKQPLILLQ